MPYLIEELWIDSLENHYSEALGYKPFGVTASREAAERIVEVAGVYIGTGWPVVRGEQMPKRRFIVLPLLD